MNRVSRFLSIFSLVTLFQLSILLVPDAVTAEGNGKENIESLIRDLENPNPAIRLDAVKNITKYKSNRAAKPLISLQLDKDSDISYMAAVALSEIQDSRTVSLLINALAVKNVHARALAVFALGRLGDTVALDSLITALNDDSEDVRINAIKALANFRESRSISPIVKTLDDPSPEVRLSAVDALGEMKDVIVSPLVTALRDSSIIVRYDAATILEEIGNERGLRAAESADFNINSLTPQELAKLGELVIFGPGGNKYRNVGKGKCPLCHSFEKGGYAERAPNLFGIIKRAGERVKEPRYLHPDTVRHEAFPGSGRATTAEEHLAESKICASCYVVAGFGVKGTNDRESPDPDFNKPPMNLTIDEMIAIDTWLYMHDGEKPPSTGVIRAAYEKFIPEDERVTTNKGGGSGGKKLGEGSIMLRGDENPQDIIMKIGCVACHKIPTTAARFGTVGPLLIEGTNAIKWIKSPEYKMRVKEGKAHATTPKEYIIESIVNPNAFIVPGFTKKDKPEESIMPKDYGNKIPYNAVSKLADFLLSLDQDTAKKDGMLQEPSSE
jgi:hypothetical protein